MYLAHRYTDASMAEIARSLGRDHPAVRNAIQKIERGILEKPKLRYQIEALVRTNRTSSSQNPLGKALRLEGHRQPRGLLRALIPRSILP